MSILIFGHKNPDTDSICSSLACAYLKKQMGMDVKACRLGEVRKEAEYALNYFGVDAPEFIEGVKEGDEVILVDHNEYGQSANGLEDATILEMIDHHKLGGIKTDAPLNVRIQTVGCTNTILYQMYRENNIEIPKDIAGLMLSAIMSDTLIYKSPTTTEADKEAVSALEKIAGVNAEDYALEMFKYGTSLDEYSIEDIVNMDFKEFDMEGNKVGIGQVFTLDIDSVLDQKDDFLDYINSTAYDMLVLAITDIINEGSYLIYKGEDDIISNAFDVDGEQGVFAEGVVSRKKQLVPNLTSALK